MDAFRTRINEDMDKLDNLSRVTHGRVRLLRTTGNPVNRIEIELNFITVPSKNYPSQKQNSTIASIELAARYPFSQPKVTFNPFVFHPNVYRSSLVCLGANWIPTEFLDLLVKRLVKILTYDPSVIDLKSAANSDAASWYSNMLHTNSTLFPTENLNAIFSPQPERPRLTFREIR